MECPPERWGSERAHAPGDRAPDPPLPAVWISLYYVAFYVVMTGIFALCIYVLMCTIDPYTPDYQDQLKSPGNWRRAPLRRPPGTRGPGGRGWASSSEATLPGDPRLLAAGGQQTQGWSLV